MMYTSVKIIYYFITSIPCCDTESIKRLDTAEWDLSKAGDGGTAWWAIEGIELSPA